MSRVRLDHQKAEQYADANAAAAIASAAKAKPMDTDDAEDTVSSRAYKRRCDAGRSGSNAESVPDDRVELAKQTLGDDTIAGLDPAVWGKMQQVLRGRVKEDPQQGL